MPSHRRAPTARTVGVLAILLALSACTAQRGRESSATGSSERASSAEPVSLTFAWPDGLRAKARTTSVKSQSLGPQARTQDLVSTYVMSARRDETGISIAFEDFQVDRPGSTEQEIAVEKLLAYRPGFTVDTEGKLVEVIGLETLRDLLVTLQQEIAAAPEEEQQSLQAVAQTVTSEQYLKGRAGSEWSNLIGTWLGKSMVPGKPDTSTVTSEPSGLMDVAIETEVTISLTRIDSCHRGDPRQCVRLQMTRQPQQDKLRDAMVPKLGTLLGVEDWGPEGPPELRSVVATSQLIVDAEPDTLVPHRVEALRVFSLEMVRPGGALQVRDSNRTTTTYEYD